MSFTVPPGPLAPVYRLDDFRDEPVDHAAVWLEVEAAARLFGELRAAGMSVRFQSDGEDGPPRVQITDLAGRVLRHVSPATACDADALEADVLGPAA